MEKMMSNELEEIREKKGSLGLYVVIGCLLIGMAGFGTSRFGTGTRSNSHAALKLGDNEISTNIFRNVLQNNRRAYPDLDNADIESMTLSQLRRDLALTNYLQQYPLAASNQAIDEQIRNNPNFFEGGAFSEAVFRGNIRIEPQQYREVISTDIAKQNFQMALATTSIISEAEITPYTEMQTLSRDILLAKIARDTFTNTADEAEIQAFYDAHKNRYLTDELVDIEYVELNPEAIAKDIEVSDEEILASGQPPRNANYYLFKDEANAQTAIERVNAGESMATVAHELANDIDDSGELDNLKPVADADSPIPQNAIDAIFALTSKGQLTAPMTVDGSVYVFELNSAPKTTLSDAEKASAKTQLQQTKAAPRVAELSEKLNKAVFESQSPSLQTIAEDTGLPIQQSGLLATNSNQGILAVPELVTAINDSDKITGKLQEPVSVGERVIIYRLTTVKAPEQKSLDSVKTAVEKAVIAEKTDKQIEEAANQLIEKTQTDGLTAAASAKQYPTQAIANFDGKVDNDGVLDPIGALFIAQQTPKFGDKNAQQVKSMNGDVYVYVNTDIRLGGEGDDAETAKTLQQSLASGMGQLELTTFLKSLSDSAAIKVRSGLLQGNDTTQ